MDEIEVEEALIQINSIHESFDTENPITFQLLLAYYKDKLNDEQKEHINNQIEYLKNRQVKIAHRMVEKMSDMARKPLTETNKEAV